MKRGILFHILIFILLAGILLPALTLPVWIFAGRWAWPFLLPQTFSLRSVTEVLGRREELAQLIFSSVLISSLTAFLSAVIGTMTARALVFYSFPGKSLISFLTILPFMVPSTVFAMGVQLIFIRMGIGGTAAGVVISHLICSLPYSVYLIMGGTEAAGFGLEEQARTLGASAWRAFLRISLPVLSPVILTAACMAYIVSFSQYFLTLLIGGGRIRTLSVVMVPYLQSGDRNMAAVYSTLFLLVTLFVFWIFEKAAKKLSGSMEGGFYE